MNRFLFVLALGFAAGGAAQAAVIDLSSAEHAPRAQVSDLVPLPHLEVIAPPAHMSELPEPEVFAMMLVGLVLLGYRVRRRDSSEKFK